MGEEEVNAPLQEGGLRGRGTLASGCGGKFSKKRCTRGKSESMMQQGEQKKLGSLCSAPGIRRGKGRRKRRRLVPLGKISLKERRSKKSKIIPGIKNPVG